MNGRCSTLRRRRPTSEFHNWCRPRFQLARAPLIPSEQKFHENVAETNTMYATYDYPDFGTDGHEWFSIGYAGFARQGDGFPARGGRKKGRKKRSNLESTLNAALVPLVFPLELFLLPACMTRAKGDGKEQHNNKCPGCSDLRT